MIPADIANRLQPTAVTRPVAAAQEVSDKLADLVPGQRLMAEIQSLMPNGTYRALINQRDVTLALPFSAKPGDALELEVVTTDGKLTLAVISRPAGDVEKPTAESASTTLSRTGQLISDLLGKASETKSTVTPTLLNGNQPIAGSSAGNAAELIPLLKQAIVQSGIFYESHQAEWVEGRLEKNALIQEPQGKLLPRQLLPASTAEISPASRLAIADVAQSMTSEATTRTPAVNAAPSQMVAAEALPIVQQQLEALATQNFTWQGQIWPGQQMRWDIDEEGAQQTEVGDDTANTWQTRLRLTLPVLGEVDARIRLQGAQINLTLASDNLATQTLLHASTDSLRKELDNAGLSLASIGVSAIDTNDTDGQLEA